ESKEAAKVRALGIGADDYIVKPFGRAELLARIAAVMRRADRSLGAIGGATASLGGPLVAGNLTIAAGRHEVRIDETLVALTPIEYRLVEVLVRANGDFVTHTQLARAGRPATAEPDRPCKK